MCFRGVLRSVCHQSAIKLLSALSFFRIYFMRLESDRFMERSESAWRTLSDYSESFSHNRWIERCCNCVQTFVIPRTIHLWHQSLLIWYQLQSIVRVANYLCENSRWSRWPIISAWRNLTSAWLVTQLPYTPNYMLKRIFSTKFTSKLDFEIWISK